MKKLKTLIAISVISSFIACSWGIVSGQEKNNSYIANIVDNCWLCHYYYNAMDSISCLKMANRKELIHAINQSNFSFGLIFHSNGEYEELVVKMDLSFDTPIKKVWKSYVDSIIMNSGNNSPYFLKVVQYNQKLIIFKIGDVPAE